MAPALPIRRPLEPAPSTALPASRVAGLSLGASLGLTVAHLLLPVLAGLGLAAAFARANAARMDGPGLAALLGGMAFAYLHDRIAPTRQSRERTTNPERSDKLRRLGPLPHGAAALAACSALLGCAAAPARLLPPMAALALVALAYPLLARCPLGKTAAVVASWTLAISVLPFAAGTVARGTAPALAGTAGVALLVASAALLCDLKDTEGDRLAGIWNLADRWGAPRALALSAGCALASLLLLPAGALGGFVLPALGLLALSSKPGLLAREISGPLAVDATLACAGLGPLLSLAFGG